MINRARARADGFTEDEIDQMETYCRDMERRGQFSCLPALVQLPKHGIVFVCETIAAAIERLRPGW
jgi:hypothetical protein